MQSSAPTTTNVERALWVTLAAATPGVVLGWVAWLGLALLGGQLASHALGLAGAPIVLFAIGWAAARRMPAPLGWLRRFHLDDAEVTAFGTRGGVRRVPWTAFDRLTQEAHALRLEGRGFALKLPLAALVRAGAFGSVLARVVPELAEEMWSQLEDGEAVRLVPPLSPPTRELAWWAYLPLLGVLVTGAGDVGVAIALVGAERLVALLGARLRSVTLHRGGLGLRSGVRRLFVPWTEAEVVSGARGLVVGAVDGTSGRITKLLPNFWVAAPVIEMKARLGPHSGALVHFRVRVAEGGLSVVGEVEPSA